jgi:type III secretion protein J
MRIPFHPALIIALALLLTGCQRVDVLSDLSEVDAIELIVLLRQNGIEAEKKPADSTQEGRWAISVPPNEASHAFMILAENDQPRAEPRGFADLFGRGNLIPTALEEKTMLLQAQAGELAQTIESMPDVIHARVHISAPEPDPLRQALDAALPAPRASVFVKAWSADGARGARVSEEDIRALVAGSVERLDPAHVSVVLKTVAPSPAPAPDTGFDPSVLFYPLAGLTLLLVALLAALAMRNRALSRQIAEDGAQRTARPVAAAGRSS